MSSFNKSLFIALIPAIFSIIFAGVGAILDVPGWGWLLFVGLLLCQVNLSHVKDNSNKKSQESKED